MCGITPKYASEVEPYPIAVTRSRFPGMIHLGDVSKVHGWDIDPVNVVTFGSPCQDMSIAGKRAGIKNENVGDEETTRSGLFHEAARIIREMREATNGVYPAFAVWENVPGAFSSNKGEDFRCVLETLIQIVEPGAVMPTVPKDGWPYYDHYCGDGWSLAYRTFDAQYWGVPQRRRRIYLVLDLTGQRAGEILFKREGLRGYFETGGTEGQGTATDAPGSPEVCDCEGCLTPWDYQSKRVYGVDGVFPTLNSRETNGQNQQAVCIPINTMVATRGKALGRGTGFGIGENGDPQFAISAAHEHAVCVPVILDDQGGQQITVRDDGISPTLRAEMHGHPPCVVSAGFKGRQGADSGRVGFGIETAPTIVSGMTADVVCAYDARGNGDGKKSSTITGDHENRITDYTTVVCIQVNCVDRSETAGCNGSGAKEDVSYTLNTVDRHAVAFRMEAFGDYKEDEVASALKARDYKDATDIVVLRYIVRRLTPTECCRLQGFPDGWGEIDVKDVLPSEENFFWLKVRQTFDKINGRPVKDYTSKQILDWYKKLHTDSAEYKMWGNGIALPNALYVMQGIAEVLNNG